MRPQISGGSTDPLARLVRAADRVISVDNGVLDCTGDDIPPDLGRTKVSMDLHTARTVIEGTRAAGREHGLKPLTVVVLDAGGHLLAAEREDGASHGRFSIAFGKAHGALALGMGSRALMVRAEQQAYFIAAATSALGGSLVPVPGGVLVRDGAGTLLGAVGVSGDSSDNDETVALAGITAAGLVGQPD